MNTTLRDCFSSPEFNELQNAVRGLPPSPGTDAIVAFTEIYERLYPLLNSGEKLRAQRLVDAVIARVEGRPDSDEWHGSPALDIPDFD